VVLETTALEDPAVPETTAREGQVGPVVPGTSTRADPVAPADPGTSTRADPVAPADPGTSTRADPVAQADLPRAEHGVGTRSVATSTQPRGETDLHPGDGVRLRARHGTDRCRRQAGSGGMAPLTTGAIKKRLCGIQGSTNGASGSSGSGSRCKGSTHMAPALPVGQAGVVLLMRPRDGAVRP
jgi:hypothetical protein